MRRFNKILSPNLGLALIVIGVVALITSHLRVWRFANLFSLLSLIVILGGIIVYVVAFNGKEKY